MATHPAGLPFVFATDRLLAPRSLGRGALGIASGAVFVGGSVRYDPARRLVVVLPNARDLRPELEYTFTVRATVLSWDGVPLHAPASVRFVPGPRAVPPPAPVVTLRRDVAPLLAARCARAACHGGAAPAMGLDLSTPAALRATTVAVVSRERPLLRSGVPEASDPRWGAMYRVDPGVTAGIGRPEYSYLVYKLLGDGPMRGRRMPPEGPPLTVDEIARVSDWIARGARDD